MVCVEEESSISAFPGLFGARHLFSERKTRAKNHLAHRTITLFIRDACALRELGQWVQSDVWSGRIVSRAFCSSVGIAYRKTMPLVPYPYH
jgi:hypothetical protein